MADIKLKLKKISVQSFITVLNTTDRKNLEGGLTGSSNDAPCSVPLTSVDLGQVTNCREPVHPKIFSYKGMGPCL